MPKPPKYELKNINPDNEFLCVKGNHVYVQRKDKDFQPLQSSLKSYYSTSTTNVPIEILNTGNVDALRSYLSGHSGELNQKEIKHLRERIDVMNYINDLEKYYQTNERHSVGKMVVNRKGQKVLPGITLDRHQDTSMGCWSCAFSMLLKGRGVELDQKIIRRYRPEFVQGREIISPEQTDTINSNMISEIYQYSSLVDKVCPNTKMCKINRNGLGASESRIRSEVFKALREKNAPVAYCNGYHWTTIVGVNDAGNKFYVVDSQSHIPGDIKEVNVNDYLGNSNAEFVWMEDIVLNKNGVSQQLPENAFKIDGQTGSVIPKIQGNIGKGANDMSTRGVHIIDESTSIETYVPRMIRDYSKPFDQQKIESNEYLMNQGEILFEDPKPIKYTPISENGFNKIKEKLEHQVNSNVITDRKSFLRDERRFTQVEIDSMTDDVANKLYTELKDKPREIEAQPQNNQPKENEFTLFNKEPEKTEPTVVNNAPEKNEFSIFENEADEKKPEKTEPSIANNAPKENESQSKGLVSMFGPQNDIAILNQLKGTSVPVPKGYSSADYKSDAEMDAVIKKLIAEDNGTTVVDEPSKPLEDYDIYHDIAEQRYAAYMAKMQSIKANKDLSPARRNLLEDIALSEFTIGSITTGYIQANDSEKELYKDSIKDALTSYLTQITIKEKLEKNNAQLNPEAEEALTDLNNMEDFRQALAKSPAVESLFNKILKNPDDIFFMNSDDVFKEFVSEQNRIVKQSIDKNKQAKKAEREKEVEPEKVKEEIKAPAIH